MTSPNAHQHHQRMLESKKIFSIIFLMMLVFLHNHSGGSDPVIILINVSKIWRWAYRRSTWKAKSHRTSAVVVRKLAAFKSTSPFWLEFVLFSTIARFSYISLHCDYFKCILINSETKQNVHLLEYMYLWNITTITLEIYS